jgi:membrane associated rhomboid family serine protease
MLQRGFSSVGLHYDPKETKGDVKKKDKGWFGATNWKQKVVWVVAIIIYVTMCQSVLSPFSGVVRVGLAAVFGAIVGLLTGIFGDKKEKQPKDDRKNQT